MKNIKVQLSIQNFALFFSFRQGLILFFSSHQGNKSCKAKKTDKTERNSTTKKIKAQTRLFREEGRGEREEGALGAQKFAVTLWTSTRSFLFSILVNICFIIH
jgi:hypothetical protein